LDDPMRSSGFQAYIVRTYLGLVTCDEIDDWRGEPGPDNIGRLSKSERLIGWPLVRPS
jgi:hypothetical protein